jgi:hypothetical protein
MVILGSKELDAWGELDQQEGNFEDETETYVGVRVCPFVQLQIHPRQRASSKLSPPKF